MLFSGFFRFLLTYLMRNEAELNRIITKSINEEGFAFKIPDTVSYHTQKHPDLPFDIFGICNGKPVYVESKFLKEPKAFNFSSLKEHQIQNLLKCKRLCPDSICLLLIGVVFGRGVIRVFYFTDMDYIYYRKVNGLSITKKEFLSMSNYVPVRKGKIDLSFIREAA